MIPDYPFEFSVIINISYMAHSRNILSILVVLLAVSCNQDKTITNTITGEISDYDEKVLMIDSDTLMVIGGKFEITNLSDYPVFRSLIYGENTKSLFIIPGNSMKITFNASDFNGTFKIDGDGVNEQIVLDSMVSIIYETFDFDRANNEVPAAVSKYLDSCTTVYLNIFDNLNKVYPTSEIFREYEKANLEYMFGFMKIQTGLWNNVTDSVYYDFTRSMVIENEKYIEIENYTRFLTRYTSFTVMNNVRNFDSLRRNDPDSVVDATLSIINTYNSKKIKEYLTYYFLKERLEYEGIEGFERFYNYFNSHNSDSSYAKEMKRRYEQKIK